MKPRRALLAVYDKQGLVEFARGLAGQGVELVATGGTERTLVEAGLTVVPVPRLTGTEEMLEGRVKTLHPAIHAGILARREHPQDMATLAGFGFQAIDLVAVNLYPFAAVLAGGGSEDSVLEAIDIGGPTLLRAAAKNHRSVAAVSDPEQYRVVLAQLEAGGLEPELLRSLAAQAFATVSSYDALIAAHLGPQGLDQGGSWPARLAWSGQLDRVLRYGENPHQAAALYRSGGGAGGLAGAERLAGEELSYTNWLDADAAWGLARALSQPAAVVVKHTNPCGVAVADHLGSAFRSAYECDPRSAYGGVVAVNRPLDLETAGLLSRHFLELLVAPGLEDGVLTLLAAKPRLRVLVVGGPGDEPPPVQLRSVDGGVLAQLPDRQPDPQQEFQVVSSRQPTPAEWAQLELAWEVARVVKSNAIVLCRDGMAVGVGAGQMSRVEAVEMAVRRAGERASGSVLASDGFFPMADGLEAAARAGVTAAIHPGGSIRDNEVLAAAEAAGLALVTTGRRHFRH